MPSTLAAHDRLALRPSPYWWCMLAVATVLAIYAPLLSLDRGAYSDGQTAQFFESGLRWSDLYAGGWPAYADPNSMAFYPLRFLFPSTRQGFDLFVLSAMAIFALGNGALAWRLTGSRAAVFLATLAAPGLGFYTAHLGHTSMVHAAAWVPWMCLACTSLSDPARPWLRATALLAVSTGLSLLAGHPQLTVFGLAGAALLVAPKEFALRDWVRSYARAGLGVALGAGLACAYMLPAATMSSESVRAAMTPALLAEFHLRPFELAVDLFPYAAGGGWWNGAPTPYVGDSATASWVENIAYVGLCLPMLVLAAFPALWRDATARRLALGATIAFALAVAPGVPGAASLFVHVPVLSMFRAWARWQFVGALFLLQLAALAYARLSLPAQSRRARAFAWAPLALIPFAWLWFALTGPAGARLTIGSGAAWFQIIVAVALCASIWHLRGNTPRSKASFARALPALLIVLELAVLARGAPWANAFTMPPHSQALLAEVKGRLAGGGRLLTMSGWTSPELAPDATRAAHIASLNWYGPLLDERFARITGITQGGWTRPDGLSDANQVFDIYGVSLIEPYVPGYLPTDRPTDALYPAPRWQRLSTANAHGLLRNMRVLPRVRVVAEAVEVGEDAAWAALTSSRLPGGQAFSARTTALVEEAGLALPAGGTVPEYEVTGAGFPAARVDFAQPTSTPTLLVIGDNYSSAFRARIDGRDARVVRVNFNQAGVPVPAGSRTVQVDYRDERMRRGAAISLACLLVIATLLALSFRFRTPGVRHDS